MYTPTLSVAHEWTNFDPPFQLQQKEFQVLQMTTILERNNTHGTRIQWGQRRTKNLAPFA